MDSGRPYVCFTSGIATTATTITPRVPHVRVDARWRIDRHATTRSAAARASSMNISNRCSRAYRDDPDSAYQYGRVATPIRKRAASAATAPVARLGRPSSSAEIALERPRAADVAQPRQRLLLD